MRCGLILSLLIAVPCWSQTSATGKAATSGSCSPANTGSNNTFIIKCGIGQKQGQQMLDILNKILANKIDSEQVMAKLDEILKAVNPNAQVRTYFCDGHYRDFGPSPGSDIYMNVSTDTSAFQEMAHQFNAAQYAGLLKTCLAQIQSTPQWLTPRLFCGLAYLQTGDKVKAKEMLIEFESKTGQSYDGEECKKMTTYLHKGLD
jgi:hypothetical protein